METTPTAQTTQANTRYKDFKVTVDRNVADVRNSLSTDISMSTASQPHRSSGGSSGRQRDTLDCDKRMQGLGVIMGTEATGVIQEWYDKVLIKLESTVPGSNRIIRDIQADTRQKTTEVIDDRMEDRIVARWLNRELVSWMTGASAGRAWGLAKPLSSTCGLESWRMVFRTITMQGPQQVQD